MKFKLIFLVLFLLPSSLYAQVSGEAIYEYTSNVNMAEMMTKKDSTSKGKEMNVLLSSIFKEQSDTLECKLLFENNKSLFFFEDYMKKEKWSIDIVYIKAELTGRIFRNNSTNEILTQHDIDGETFIVKKNTNETKWKLENEKKHIGKYVCYKATAIEQVYRSSGNHKEKLIEAWYAPSLTINFGPNGYGGLPGFIVELKGGNQFIFSLKEITLDKDGKKKTVVENPTKGKLVTEDEYRKIQNDIRDQRRRNRN